MWAEVWPCSLWVDPHRVLTEWFSTQYGECIVYDFMGQASTATSILRDFTLGNSALVRFLLLALCPETSPDRGDGGRRGDRCSTHPSTSAGCSREGSGGTRTCIYSKTAFNSSTSEVIVTLGWFMPYVLHPWVSGLQLARPPLSVSEGKVTFQMVSTGRGAALR